MSHIDERSRHELYLSIEALIGAERAETLMSMLPPVGWADVATKDDLAALDARFEAKLHRELTRQTRTMIFALIGALFTMTSLNLTAVALLR